MMVDLGDRLRSLSWFFLALASVAGVAAVWAFATGRTTFGYGAGGVLLVAVLLLFLLRAGTST